MVFHGKRHRDQFKKAVVRMLNMKIILFYVFYLIASIPFSANAMEVLGYTLRNDSVGNLTDGDIARQNKSIKINIHKINIIAPQAYQVDDKGTLWGSVDPWLIDFTKKNNVKLMPLVTNALFDDIATNKFLHNQFAEQHAIDEMVKVCKANHYAGLQIDFEHILLKDRNAYSLFFEKVAKALHNNGFLASVTIVPRLTDRAPVSYSGKLALEHWNGAYDYAALGKTADFVTLMAYDQHGSWSTPGSPSGPGWEKKIIVFALKHIPADKISLGLPVHSSYWYTDFGGKKTQVTESDLTYSQMHYLLQEHHAEIHWNKKNDVPDAIFSSHDLNQYVFPENAATFKIQWALAKKYKLRGVSLWRLGYEDPEIWNVI